MIREKDEGTGVLDAEDEEICLGDRLKRKTPTLADPQMQNGGEEFFPESSSYEVIRKNGASGIEISTRFVPLSNFIHPRAESAKIKSAVICEE